MTKETAHVEAGTTAQRFSNGTVVELPGWAGTADLWTNDVGAFRSYQPPALDILAPEFHHALQQAGIQEQETIDLDVRPTPAAATRGAAAADRLVLRPARTPMADGGIQVVLYQDESGGLSWHYPDGHLSPPGTAPTAARYRTGAAASFTIPLRTEAAQASLQQGGSQGAWRGPIARRARKILKVFVIPIVSAALARPVEAIVGAVERRVRQELARAVTPDNYRQRVTQPVADWNRLAGKPTLLIIHGTFSTTEGFLNGLPRPAMEEWSRRYEGRVVALDHLTVTRSPEENAKTFLETLAREAPGKEFQFDVVAHSRGGLVARCLAENPRRLVPTTTVAVRSVYFVATPNQGTPLADPDHIVDFIDAHTNFLTNLKDGPVLYSMELVLALVKVVAHAAGTNLPGLAAMSPKGWIARFNTANHAPNGFYAGAASDYEPDPRRANGFLTGRLGDAFLDRVFTVSGQRVANDLVVPTDGVGGANGHSAFPLASLLRYRPADAVWHSGFLSHPRTLNEIKDHWQSLDAWSSSDASGEATPAAEAAEDVAMPGPSAPTVEPIGHSMTPARRYRGGLGTAAPPPSAPAPVLRDALTMLEPPVRPVKLNGGPTANGGSKPAAPEPDTLWRDPHIDFHEDCEEGITYPLVVKLAQLAGPAVDDAIGIAMDEGQDEVQLLVTLSAPGFRVAPAPFQYLTVKHPYDANKEAVTFDVTPLNPGAQPKVQELRADFWNGNASIGSVVHRTEVVPAGWTEPVPGDGSCRRERFSAGAARRNDCDLVVSVDAIRVGGRPWFRMSLRSEIPEDPYMGKDCGEFELPAEVRPDLPTYVKSFLDAQFQTQPNTNGMTPPQEEAAWAQWEQGFLAALNDFGKRLWTFLPPLFRAEYFRLHRAGHPPRSILIHSDDMVYPWELVVPHDNSTGTLEVLEPLGRQHVLGRWRPGLPMRPVPQEMEVRGLVVVNPQYPGRDALPWSVEEAKQVGLLFPKADVVTPADLGTLRSRLLARSDVQFVHFTGHGEFQPANADLSRLRLENGTALDAMALTGTALGSQGRPFLYLNACSVGAAGSVVGRPGGFAAVCLDAGFSGVIAPHWPVNDASAKDFALALYAKLAGGRSVGEALTEVRWERKQDPTAQAFAYYGDPWARLRMRLS